MDSRFFEQMAMPLFDQLYNLAHWLTGDRIEAEDLVQETYAKALKGFKSFEQGTNLRAWMYRILRNTFLTSRSGLAAQNTYSLDDDEIEKNDMTTHYETPELLFLRQENRQTVMDALASIPVAYREILLLCEVEELSYREIAQMLAVPIGTVMSRLARARTLLRQTRKMNSVERSSDAL
jgi:RNA polymerase sigma-70 factor (ECF subfamily)